MTARKFQVHDGGRSEPKKWAGKWPPHDLGAEAEVLGELLLHPELLPVARGTLEPEDFFSEPNQTVAEAIWACDELIRDSGLDAQVDVGLVMSWLKDRARVHEIADPTAKGDIIRKAYVYLVKLRDLTPGACHSFAARCRRVKDKARARAMTDTLWAWMGELYNDYGDDMQKWLDDAAATMRSHVVADSPAQLETIGTYVDDVLDDMLAEPELDDAGNRKVRGLATGLADFDAATGGLQDGDMWLVSARPGSGKTAMAIGWCIDTASTPDPDGALRNGVFMWSGEMPARRVLRRAACRQAGVSLGKVIKGSLDAQERSALLTCDTELKALPWIIDDRKGLSVEAIRGAAHRARLAFEKRGQRLRLVACDYVQLMGRPQGLNRHANRTEELDVTGQRLVALAEELQVPLVVIAKLNRANKIEGSSALEFHTQNWLQLKAKRLGKDEPEDTPRPATLNIEKQRDGAPVTIKGWFHGAMQRFTGEDEQWL